MWKPDHFRLFICHVASYKEVAHFLKEELEKVQVSCFVAHDDIEPTRQWQDEIAESLRTMDALAAILSPDFHSSNWTDQEVGFAIGTGRLVLPLRLGLDPYGFIGRFQGYQIAGIEYPTLAQQIVKVLSRHDQTALKMASALVKLFEESWTWDSAKATMSLLEECTVIDEVLLTRIEETGNCNPQVRSAFGVPARIRTLVAKHRKIGETQ
jgi:hypothetical protein